MIHRLVSGALLAAVCLVGGGGCGGEARLSSYEQNVLQARFERDMALRDPQRTILAPDVRKRFGGLHYFPVDSTLRFRARLVRAAVPETVRVSLHLGGSDPYVRIGHVEVPLPGGPYRLSAFQPASGQPVLWLPFIDATSGRETYGGGRYLYPALGADGSLVVDFNEAHNPNCDYNPTVYNCAMPPSENRLPVAVRAGEMKSRLVEEAG